MQQKQIPLTGPAAIEYALSKINLDGLREKHLQIIKSGAKSKRTKSVQALNAIEGLKRNSLTPDKLLVKNVPVVPPVFRPFSVVGNTFVPGDANELYRDLFQYRDMHNETEAILGTNGAAQAKLDLYDTVKALYGYGTPIAPKTKQRGVAGFLTQVTGTNPKYCYDDKTDILTADGWVKFADLREGLSVATINPNTLAFEWQVPHAYTHSYYNGKMVEYKNKRVDLLVTPNHRMWVRPRDQKENLTSEEVLKNRWIVETAEQLADRRGRYWIQTAACSWEGTSVFVPEVFSKVPIDLFAQWLGWWIAEGDIHTDNCAVNIWQTLNNLEHCAELDVLFSRLASCGLTVSKTAQRKAGILIGHAWTIKGNRSLARWCEEYCGRGAANKRIPKEIREWGSKHLKILFTSYLKGDGSKTKRKINPSGNHKFRNEITNTFKVFSTISSELYDNISEIACKLGLTITRNKWYPHLHSPACKEAYIGSIIGRWNTTAEGNENVNTVDYSGGIHCCSTNNGLLIVRRNGKTVVSGNSYFQRKLISKPQDSVSRGTIAVDPDLSLDEIGVPLDMAWTMYSPYIQRRLVQNGMSPASALQNIKDRTDYARKALDKEVTERPVIYSRAPSWHKFNVLSGRPKLIEGNTIAINPLVTTGLNADFDGDAMNLHVPSQPDAVEEAWKKLMPSKMLFSIRNHDQVVPIPKQELILGLYTANRRDAKAKHVFSTEEEALKAIRTGSVNLSDDVEIKAK
jgi:hypothetical protein